MAKLLTFQERNRILEQYTHTIEIFSNEEDIDASPEVQQFEEEYAYDEELSAQMRRAKEKKKNFLKIMSGKMN